MNNLTNEQIAGLAEFLNDRLAEFDIDDGVAPLFEPLTKGVARVLYAGFGEWQEKQASEVNNTAASEDAMDAYWRGYTDGAMVARGQMAHAAERPTESLEVVGVGDNPLAYVGSVATLYSNGSTTTVIGSEVERDKDSCGEKENEFPAIDPYPRGYEAGHGDGKQSILEELPAITTMTMDEAIQVEHYEIGYAQGRAMERRDHVSDATAATLGPEHTIVTPLRPIGRDHSQFTPRGRTLAEADELAAELSKIIAALQSMASDGQMPSVMTWDGDRPSGMYTWQAMQKRHDIPSWGKLASMAGLAYSPSRGGRPTNEAVRTKPGPQLKPIPTFEELIAELQRQSVGTGIMPSQATFNTAKPATWPMATSLCQRFDVSWETLAKAADLKPRQHGPVGVGG